MRKIIVIATCIPLVRQSLTSVIFCPRFKGRKLAAQILWAPGLLFPQEYLHAEKIPCFRGAYFGGAGGGGSVNCIFMGAGIFLKFGCLGQALFSVTETRPRHWTRGENKNSEKKLRHPFLSRKFSGVGWPKQASAHSYLGIFRLMPLL